MAKTATKTSPKTTTLTADLKALEFQSVQITGGKKFPVGSKATVLKVDVSKRFNTVYAMIRLEGQSDNVFIDPKWLKPLGAVKNVKAAALQAELEADREATIIVSGKVREERELSVLLDHHGWYQPRWFPKSLLTEMTSEPMENGENLYEAPLWKVRGLVKDKGVEALMEHQELWQSIIDNDDLSQPAPKAQPKAEVIKAGTPAAKAAKAAAATVVAAKPVGQKPVGPMAANTARIKARIAAQKKAANRTTDDEIPF